MLFPTHLVVAVGIGIVSRFRAVSATGRAPRPPLSLGWLVVGAALPDLIDKPLGMAGVTELYHSIGHSAILLAVALVVALADRRGGALASRRGLSLAIGWGSHLFLDAVHVVINGRPSDALFLGWPLVVPPNPPAIPPGEFVWFYLGSPSFYVEVLLWLAVGVLVVWSLRRKASDIPT